MIAKKSTRGQVQFNETILVLFVVVVLIALGIFMYYKYSIQSIQDLGDDLSEEQASVMLASITNMPEFRCSNEDCIDMGKVMAFNAVGRQNLDDYARVFGSKRITIEKLYPISSRTGDCTIERYNQVDYPDNCDIWVVFDNKKSDFSNKIIISSPISIYFPENGRYGVGKIVLEVYR